MYIAVVAILSECYHTAAAANCCKPVIGIFKCEELHYEAPVLGIEKKSLESSSKSEIIICLKYVFSSRYKISYDL